jgi:hypothetical protein
MKVGCLPCCFGLEKPKKESNAGISIRVQSFPKRTVSLPENFTTKTNPPLNEGKMHLHNCCYLQPHRAASFSLLVKKFSPIIKAQVDFIRTAAPYPKPDEHNLHTQFNSIHFNIILPCVFRSTKWPLSFGFSDHNVLLICNLLLVPHAHLRNGCIF